VFADVLLMMSKVDVPFAAFGLEDNRMAVRMEERATLHGRMSLSEQGQKPAFFGSVEATAIKPPDAFMASALLWRPSAR
jgi:hypothetical protein